MFNRFGRRAFRVFNNTNRKFGAGPVHDPVPDPFWTRLGFSMQVIAYLWIFHRMKEDKGQLFGLYKPWEDDHHHDHVHYEYDDVGKPRIVQHEDGDH